MLLLFFGQGAQPDTHDGADRGGSAPVRREEIERIRRRLGRLEDARSESFARQREAGRQLVEAIAATYRAVSEEAPGAAEEMATALAPAVRVSSLRAPRSVDWRPLLNNLAAIERFIRIAEAQLSAYRARYESEEEDIAILMLAIA